MKRVFRLIPPRRQTAKEKQIAECYTRSPEGDIIVRLRLNSPTAILMPFEGIPANFGNETTSTGTDADANTDIAPPVLNLNKDFVDYLFARLAEVGNESLLLRVAFTDTPTLPAFSPKVLHTVIHRYFAYLEDVRRQNLQKLAWDAALLGLCGAGALVLSVVLDSRTASVEAGIGLMLLTQGVTVFGWLTFWEALANVLWHWRPLYEQLRMCQRLQTAKLEIVSANS
ncbi:MAG: hypothetical protein WA901_13215 [Phormidesmis sp.]